MDCATAVVSAETVADKAAMATSWRHIALNPVGEIVFT
jgi:hypothetical protein